MLIRNPNSHELMTLPRGAAYLAARASLAGGDLTQVPMESITTAERLLQTADCVGTLVCCKGCEIVATPCPVAMRTRQAVTAAILGRPAGIEGVPDERSVLIAAMDAWQTTYADEQAAIAQHLALLRKAANAESEV
ncbi:MAG: hypothetical protein KIH63_002500 [Candidatus Saccharibacteria bacterium]|nr:hypothetical protein [Candidatus Saccharibacteria bacterium]